MRLLLLDDEEDVFVQVRALARAVDPSWIVEWTPDPATAETRGVSGEVDVLLVDYQLGPVDGLSVLRAVLEKQLFVPVIVCTGRTDRAVDEAALASGACDFLPKQELSPERLSRVVRYAIARSRQARQLATERDSMDRMRRTDPLTGLGNRSAFEEELARRQETGFDRGAVMVLADLDGLKAINDSYGHEAGDDAIRSIGSALKLALRHGDLIYRIGGDEFAAILPAGSATVTRRLPRVMTGESVGQVTPRASVGWAVAERGELAARLRRRADADLYRVKLMAPPDAGRRAPSPGARSQHPSAGHLAPDPR